VYVFGGRCLICVFLDLARILVWNVRGLNSSSQQDAIHTLVEASRADIVWLQETKMAVVPQGVLLSMLGTDFSSHVELPATGASRGIIVAWRHALGTIGQYRVDTFSVLVQFCADEGQLWWVTCVYGPQGSEEKILFMQELRDIRAHCQGPWMIAGDFNLIYKAEDKNNTNYNRAMMGRFQRLINDLAVKDVPLHGRKYTWSTQQTSPTLVRLDRVLSTVEWELIYPNAFLQSAAKFDSDRCQLLLGLKDNKVGKRRFHFEAFWPKLEGFHEAVE
jgi:exonuclease III